KVLHPPDAPVIAMIFLHLFDSSKTAACFAACLFGWQTGSDRIELGHFQVGTDFAFQLPIETPLANQPQQTSCGEPKLHDSASRNLATSAVALSQFATATLSCLAPVRVSE